MSDKPVAWRWRTTMEKCNEWQLTSVPPSKWGTQLCIEWEALYLQPLYESEHAANDGLELWQAYCDKKMECDDLREEIERLQMIIDSRPAINAGLPETYINWSQGIMQADIAKAIGHDA